jgi:hypothetical protein
MTCHSYATSMSLLLLLLLTIRLEAFVRATSYLYLQERPSSTNRPNNFPPTVFLTFSSSYTNTRKTAMPTYSKEVDLKVHVQVNGEPIREYIDKNATQDANVITRYIEATVNSEFELAYSISGLNNTNKDIRVTCNVDGTVVIKCKRREGSESSINNDPIIKTEPGADNPVPSSPAPQDHKPQGEQDAGAGVRKEPEPRIKEESEMEDDDVPPPPADNTLQGSQAALRVATPAVGVTNVSARRELEDVEQTVPEKKIKQKKEDK